MGNHEILNNISHQDTKVITDMTPELVGQQSYATLALSELNHAQANFPIFLRKNEQTEAFELIALLGLGPQENLYINEKGWQAHYIPLSIKRQPFFIGFQQRNGQNEPVVFIDMDNPRVNSEQGEALFMQHGGQSGFLQDVSGMLKIIHEGHQAIPKFVENLQKHSLVEPINLNIELNNKEKISIPDLYTIHEERLAALSVDAIGELHQSGYLRNIYMMIASTSNVTKLIALKNGSL